MLAVGSDSPGKRYDLQVRSGVDKSHVVVSLASERAEAESSLVVTLTEEVCVDLS